jgi:hypothetical protein
MSKPFDSMLNSLIDGHESNWAGYFGARAEIVPGPATALDTDLSTTLQADRLFRIDGPEPAVLHLELEATGKLGRPAQLLRYNVAAWGMTDLPVHSVLIVLRPKANATDLTGQYDILKSNRRSYLNFQYTVVRLWQESLSDLLQAGPGVAPLAMLTDEAAANLSAAFTRFRNRLREDDVPDNVEEMLLGSAYILCGLRYSKDQIENLYRELNMTLEDSTTYQDILSKGLTRGRAEGKAEGIAEGKAEGKAEGRVEGKAELAKKILVQFGRKWFGSASPDAETAIFAISNLDQLERMVDRLDEASGWEDLLATT